MLTATSIPNKIFLFAGIISAVYFGVLFSNVLQYVDLVLAGVIVELFTLPMILVQLFIIGYMLHLIFIRKIMPSPAVIICFVVAVFITIAVVLSFIYR